jgi:hypothetical protein
MFEMVTSCSKYIIVRSGNPKPITKWIVGIGGGGIINFWLLILSYSPSTMHIRTYLDWLGHLLLYVWVGTLLDSPTFLPI